jgi:hypothetical protein
MKSIFTLLLIILSSMVYGQGKMTYKSFQWKDLKTNKVISDSVDVIRTSEYFDVTLGKIKYHYSVIGKKDKKYELKNEYIVLLNHQTYILVVVLNGLGTSIGIEGEWEIDNIDLNNTFIKY